MSSPVARPPAMPPSDAPASAHITLRNLVMSRWVLLALVLAAALLELGDAAPESLAAWVPAAEHPAATFATHHRARVEHLSQRRPLLLTALQNNPSRLTELLRTEEGTAKKPQRGGM